jgi:ABC-type transporter Mla subunit MlaD
MNRARAASYAALALVVVAVVIVLTGGSTNGYKVYAAFRDVDGLRQGSSVKVDGVAAGTVTKVTVTKQSTAYAELTLDPGVGPIGANASIQIRPTDLLGERYAQLTLGNLSQPQRSGSFIPLSRTSAPVDLDQVLDMANAPLRERLRILINEAGIALAGRGADFNQLLAAMPPDLGQAQQLLGQIASENASLENLISEGEQDSSAVYNKRLDMGHVISVADEALNSIVLRQQQLGQTIQNAPGALAELHTTLDEVGTASLALTPAAASLQQAAQPLTQTLRELPKFARSAQRTLVTAKQIAPQITKLGTQARAPLVALRPTARALQGITRSAAPILNQEDQRGMADLLWFVENFELGTKGRDSISHFIGADLELDTSVLQSAVDGFINNTGLSSGLHRSRNAPVRRVVAPPAVTPPTPAATPAPKPTPLSGVKKLLGGVTGLAGGLTGGLTTVLKGATGSVAGTVGKIGGTVGGVLNGLLHPGAAPSTPSAPSGGPANGLSHLLNFLIGK